MKGEREPEGPAMEETRERERIIDCFHFSFFYLFIYFSILSYFVFHEKNGKHLKQHNKHIKASSLQVLRTLRQVSTPRSSSGK
jgi:hypothetical protein